MDDNANGTECLCGILYHPDCPVGKHAKNAVYDRMRKVTQRRVLGLKDPPLENYRTLGTWTVERLIEAKRSRRVRKTK